MNNNGILKWNKNEILFLFFWIVFNEFLSLLVDSIYGWTIFCVQARKIWWKIYHQLHLFQKIQKNYVCLRIFKVLFKSEKDFYLFPWHTKDFRSLRRFCLHFTSIEKKTIIFKFHFYKELMPKTVNSKFIEL